MALPGIRLRVLNEKGKPCKPGQEGNVCLIPPFAPGLLRGIWRDEKKFLDTYWSQYPGGKVYFSGDLGVKDENGMLRIIGRADDQIKVAGHRLTTGEMESAIARHPGTAESAVVGVFDEIKGEVPIVFAVAKIGAPVEIMEKEIIALIRKEIGAIATPKSVYIVPDLPKTRSGKIMRRLFRKIIAGEELGDLSTLANPESVARIKAVVNQRADILRV
jgi:acyl-coenzyme A synthetase/AMP-(fatty) acid ligase